MTTMTDGPAQSGQDLQDPKEMDSEPTNETTENTQTMSQNDTNQNAIAQNIKNYGHLYARQVGINQYSVLNTSDDLTAYNVNIRELSCECEHGQHKGGSGEVCKHLAVAIHNARKHTEMDTAMLQLTRDVLSDLSDASERMMQVASSTEAELYAQTSGSAGEDTTSESGTTPDQESGSSADVEAAADKLQSAFDDVIDDMEIETSGGVVWFKTGYDTPDSWPFPGGDETFKVITSPEMVKYVHDGSADWADSPHPLYEDKPGEYFNNALDPEAVDSYINEVLA